MAREARKVEAMTGISSMAMRQVLTELTEAYEQRSGQPIVLTSVGGVDAVRRVAAGEGFDFVVLATNAIQKLAADGRVDPRSPIDLAHSGVAVAVPAGAPRPDIGSEAALRDAVLGARSIGYSTGPSGAHLVRLFERWGIASVIAPRIVQAARGDIELAFQQLSELMHLPGIDVVGPLPPEVQVMTVFSAAVCTASHREA